MAEPKPGTAIPPFLPCPPRHWPGERLTSKPQPYISQTLKGGCRRVKLVSLHPRPRLRPKQASRRPAARVILNLAPESQSRYLPGAPPQSPRVAPAVSGRMGAALIRLAAQARGRSNMNLVGSYAISSPPSSPPSPSAPRAPHAHEPFLFGPASRCHQERPYFQSWLLEPADAALTSPPAGHLPQPRQLPSPMVHDARPGQSPGRLEALGGRLGRRKGSGPKKERRRHREH